MQQQKIDTLHQLDIQHTEELNNAKAELDRLHDAVRAGTKRLRVNAVCRAPKNATPPRADMMKPSHNLVSQLNKIISVSEK
ncbi:MAG TPA: lysis system i-spanin subunit Rz [Arsenophonus sp.]